MELSSEETCICLHHKIPDKQTLTSENVDRMPAKPCNLHQGISLMYTCYMYIYVDVYSYTCACWNALCTFTVILAWDIFLDLSKSRCLLSSIGVYNLPVICVGYFVGGLMMKKFKISTYKAAHLGFWSYFIQYLIYFSAFFMGCKSASVAGLTVSYEGCVLISSHPFISWNELPDVINSGF